MGWTFQRGTPTDRRAFLDALYTATEGDATQRVLKSAMVGSTYYAALELVRDGARKVLAGVCLTKRDQGEFGWKDMDETMGPYEAACPAAILDLLTETDRPFALEWRAKCRANAAAKAARRTDPLQPGDVITFETPLTFTSGLQAATVTCVQAGRRERFRLPSGMLVRLGRPGVWRSWPHVITRTAAAA